MSLDLLKERLGSSVSTNKKEVDKEKLNEIFNSNPMENLESFKSQHKRELEEKDRIIENLESEASNLANQVLKLEKDKSTLLENINQSKWLENTVASNTKKIYEEKIKKMSYVDSTELIPMLIEVSRKKQGLEKLNWGDWLKIPENRYLLQINENVAKKIFENTNWVIDKAISNINRKRTRGGDVPTVENYFMSFTGNDEHNQEVGGELRNDTARVDLVATQFTPNDPTNVGFSSGDRKPLAESGFTVAYWFNPYENYSDSFPVGYKWKSDARFEFGISTHTKPYFSIGSNQIQSITWATMFDTSGNSDLKNTLLDNGVGTDPGSGTKLILNKWYHMVYTYAGTDNVDGDGNYLRKIYINGNHIFGGFGEAKQSHNWTNNLGSRMTKGLSFGMRAVVASGNHTDGLSNTKYNNGLACGLDEVAIYSEAKDATWVSSVYNGGTGYNHKDSGGDGLVGYWRFNEGSGTTVEDLSGYGWHGTLTNAGFGTKIDGDPDNSSTIEGIYTRFPNAKPTWNEIDNSVKTLESL
jgi:hypothetical protein